MFHRSKTLCTRLMFAGVTLFLVVAAGLVAVTPTYAQSPSPTPQAQRREDLREKQFKREQEALAKQQDHLNRAATLVTKAQAYLDQLKSQGKDTTALQAALSTFNSQVATAQSAHNTAADVLNRHIGFDADGQVTNLAQATQTVIDARQSLWDANRILRQAALDLARVIRSYRRSNSGT